MTAIRAAAAKDAIFVGDVGVCNHRGANYCLDIYTQRSYIAPAWGGLGFGLPAAAGAQAAAPDRQVICITGDGGVQFNIQELGTCVQYGLKPVILVFNDNAWGLLRQYQENRYDGRYIASDLQSPDFTRLAAAYGARGVQAASLAEMVNGIGRGAHRGDGYGYRRGNAPRFCQLQLDVRLLTRKSCRQFPVRGVTPVQPDGSTGRVK